MGMFLSVAVQDLSPMMSSESPDSRMGVSWTHLWCPSGTFLDQLEDLKRSLFDSPDGHLPCVDASSSEVKGPPLVVTRHLEVNSSVNSNVETVCSTPVAHKHAVEPPLLADDSLQYVRTLRHVGAVEAVVAVVEERVRCAS